MPFEIEFIRNTLEAEGFHLESDGPLDNFYNFAVAIREQTIKELQGGPRADIVDELLKALIAIGAGQGDPKAVAIQALENYMEEK